MPTLEPRTTDSLNVFGHKLLNEIENAPYSSLGAGPLNKSLGNLLTSGHLSKHFEVLSATALSLCKSGLWLLTGDLDRSHAISQDLPQAEGSFWHGIMHRREGDFGNAKYWFRRVGSHPVIDQLSAAYPEEYRNAGEFVDLCERAISTRHPDKDLVKRCEAIQWSEWQWLMCWCIDNA